MTFDPGNTIHAIDADGTVHNVTPLPYGQGAATLSNIANELGLMDRIKLITQAAQHGAEMVYHAVAAVEQDVAQWRETHPEVSKLMDKGVAFAASWLARMVPGGAALVVIGHDIQAALSNMAAADPAMAPVAAERPADQKRIAAAAVTAVPAPTVSVDPPAPAAQPSPPAPPLAPSPLTSSPPAPPLAPTRDAQTRDGVQTRDAPTRDGVL